KRRPGLTGRNRPGTPRLALCAALPMGRAFLILGVVRPAIVATHIPVRALVAARSILRGPPTPFPHCTTGGIHPCTSRSRLLQFLRSAFPQEARRTPHSRPQVN